MKKRGFRSYLLPVLVLALFFLPFSGFSQSLLPVNLYWKQATLILTNGDTLQGQASLSLPNDMVHFSPLIGEPVVFNPSQVRYFDVREPHQAIPFRSSGELLLHHRVYGQYNWNRDNDYGTHKGPALFVVVVPGKYALLLREHKEQIPSAGGGSLAGFAAGQALKEANNSAYASTTERFYLSIDGKEAKWLRHPRKDLLAYFPDKKKAIEKYAGSHGLAFNRVDHLARIVAYCNSL